MDNTTYCPHTITCPGFCSGALLALAEVLGDLWAEMTEVTGGGQMMKAAMDTTSVRLWEILTHLDTPGNSPETLVTLLDTFTDFDLDRISTEAHGVLAGINTLQVPA